MSSCKEIFLEKTESTNSWAKKHLNELNPNEITCIWTDEQTHGYGRCKRCWVSPKGENLYVTFYFQLPSDTLHIISIAQVFMLSCIEVFAKEGVCVAKIKWPNDIFLKEKKAAGVLCETTFDNDKVNIFLGFGINVNANKEDLEKIDQPATSLKEETGKIWNRKDLLEKIKSRFINDLEVFKKKGFAPFHNKFENLLLNKGKMVSCVDGNKEIKGIIHSITCDGQLNLYNPETKEMKTISSGDIVC